MGRITCRWSSAVRAGCRSAQPSGRPFPCLRVPGVPAPRSPRQRGTASRGSGEEGSSGSDSEPTARHGRPRSGVRLPAVRHGGGAAPPRPRGISRGAGSGTESLRSRDRGGDVDEESWRRQRLVSRRARRRAGAAAAAAAGDAYDSADSLVGPDAPDARVLSWRRLREAAERAIPGSTVVSERSAACVAGARARRGGVAEAGDDALTVAAPRVLSTAMTDLLRALRWEHVRRMAQARAIARASKARRLSQSAARALIRGDAPAPPPPPPLGARPFRLHLRRLRRRFPAIAAEVARVAEGAARWWSGARVAAARGGSVPAPQRGSQWEAAAVATRTAREAAEDMAAALRRGSA